jgi:antitoxin YokJ
MRNLLDRIAGTSGCRVFPVDGFPAIESNHRLPDDLDAFYRMCGGVEFFVEAPFPVRISSPSELVLANPVIIGQLADDISDSWYIIGRGGGDELISIDLDPDRAGKCYDSFQEIHGVPGSSSVVALSFTDLLERLLAARGGHWYWLEPDFVSLGDAYDAVRLCLKPCR